MQHFFSFDKFITPKLIVIFFWLMIVLSALGFLSVIFTASGGGQVGIWQILVSLVGFLIGIIFIKMFCEMVLVGFKINENLQAIRERGDKL